MNAAARAARVHQSLAAGRARLAAAADEVLARQIAIARVPSPTFSESRRAALVAQRLEEAGWRVRLDDAGNVVARLHPSTEPAVAVCAHLDTVYATDDTPEVVRDRSIVRGSGICDNSRGLAGLIALADALRAVPTAIPVELVATTAEEGVGDLRGARHHVAEARPLALIALDGAGDERIVTTALGARRFRVSYRGAGGHSWSARGMANPVQAAAHCAHRLAQLRPPAGAVLTVTRIGGGTTINAIAEDAWLDIDSRSTREDELSRMVTDIRDAAEESVRHENARRTAGDPLRLDIQQVGDRPCGHTPDDDPLVEAAVAATGLVGRRPELCSSSTDASAAVAAGIPAIAIGAGGRGGDTHSALEWFDATDASRGLERALTIIATAARAGVSAP